MKLKSFVALCLVLLLGIPALAVGPTVDAVRNQVRKNIESLGFEITDEEFEQVSLQISEYMKIFKDDPLWVEEYNRPETFAYNLLLNEGFGNYDYDTLTWTPTSDKLYVLDAEVFNVGQMYTEFLQGINSIVTDVEFTDVSEDLSGMDEESDYTLFHNGSRSVTFKCNGRTYTAKLTNYLDWLDPKIITFINQVLEKEGCVGRIHCVSEDYDQLLFLIYGSEDDADALRKIMGTVKSAESWVENQDYSFLDILAGLLKAFGDVS